MANPPGNHQEPAHGSSSAFNGNGNLAPETSGTASAMKHNPGISMEWTAEEQSMLDHGLSEFASESSIIRYAKIAMQLKDKTVRDVALRVRWMTKKENSRRRKEEHNLSRKSKEKKERANDPSVKSSQFAVRPIVLPHALPMVPMDNDDGIPYKAIGGLTGEMLEQNAQAFNQISANLAAFQIQENINLFCQTRDNILKIMNELSDQPEIMKQMPALPVKVNEELANTILPRTTLLAYRDPNHLLRLRIKHIQLICGPTFYSNFVSLSLIHSIKILEPVHEAGLKNKLVARVLLMTGLGCLVCVVVSFLAWIISKGSMFL